MIMFLGAVQRRSSTACCTSMTTSHLGAVASAGWLERMGKCVSLASRLAVVPLALQTSEAIRVSGGRPACLSGTRFRAGLTTSK